MSSVSTQSLRQLGELLHEALVRLISIDGRLPRPTDLSRWWNLDQTLCVRTCSALRNDDPLRVLHQLSSTGSLRSIVEAGRARGIEAATCDHCDGAIGQLEEVIGSLGGKKANLDTLIGSNLVEARQKIEATSKQSIFRGMSNLLGLSSETVFTAYFVTPSDDDPTWCDELAVYGSRNLRRLRPELTTLVGGRVLVGESPEETADELERAREVLHSGKIDHSGFSTALKDFCTDPFPEVDVLQSGRRILYTLPADPSGESRETTLFFASIDRHASRRVRSAGDENGAEAPFLFLPRNPAKDMLLDVFVHDSLWREGEPRLDIGRMDALLRPHGTRSAVDQFDFCESLQMMGRNPSSLAFSGLPSYKTMLGSICEDAGLELADYRLYRLHVRYPVVSLGYGIYFPVPVENAK